MKSVQKSVIDPICKMTVIIKATSLSHEYLGEKYYFCSKKCQEKFKENPEYYLSKEYSPSMNHGPKITSKGSKLQYYCPMLCEGDKIYDQKGDCPICGMDLIPTVQEEELNRGSQEYSSHLKSLILSIVFSIPVLILSMGDMVTNGAISQLLKSPSLRQYLELLFSIPVAVFIAYPVYKKAWVSFKTGHYNMFTLIGLGTFISFTYSLIATFFPHWFPKNMLEEGGVIGVYYEAAVVIITFLFLGQTIEARSKIATTSALKSLLSLAVKEAVVIKNGKDTLVLIEDIQVGDKIRIRIGDKIPIDGVLSEGHLYVDEAMLSGEATAVLKKEGHLLTGGTINLEGNGIMEVTRVASESVLSQIVQITSEAQRSKANIQNMADKISAFLIPIVMIVSVSSFFIWYFFGPSPSIGYGLIAAVSVFIIACPCALGLATPMAITVATSKAAQGGLLFRNANALENFADIDTLVVDKTGTLTEGKPSVNHAFFEKEEVKNNIYNYIYIMEKMSAHPIANAMINHIDDLSLDLKNIDLKEIKETVGVGLSANHGNISIEVGSEALLEKSSTPWLDQKVRELKQQQETLVIFRSNQYGDAIFGLKDAIKHSSYPVIDHFKKLGIHIILATGDHLETSKHVAKQLGISSVYTRVKPQDKIQIVRELQEKGHKVAMMGDGINDAPALSQANVSIAMSNGSDIAIQSSDITLFNGDLSRIEVCYNISKKTMKTIKENLFFSFLYNLVGVFIAAGALYPFFGLLLNPMIAAAAMSLSSTCVILNSLRLNLLKVAKV